MNGISETRRETLRPLFDRVVIKEFEPDRMRKSGIVIPEGNLEPPPDRGIIIAAGAGMDWWQSAGLEMPVSVGDHVLFPRHAGTWIELDEERLLVMRVGEILGVVE